MRHLPEFRHAGVLHDMNDNLSHIVKGAEP